MDADSMLIKLHRLSAPSPYMVIIFIVFAELDFLAVFVRIFAFMYTSENYCQNDENLKEEPEVPFWLIKLF